MSGPTCPVSTRMNRSPRSRTVAVSRGVTVAAPTPGIRAKALSDGVAPTEPKARLSLTLPTLLDTDLLALHVTGDSKLATLRRASCPGSALEMPVRALLEQRRVPLEIYHAP